VASIVDRVVGGGEDAAVSAADAAWLVEAMARSDAVADAAWDAMATLCATGDAASSRAALGEANAMTAASTTLQRDDIGEGTVVACLRAVANWCGDESDDDEEEDDDGDDESEGFLDFEFDELVAAIVSMMRRLRCSAVVAEHSCLALSRIALSDYGAESMRDEDGVGAVTAAMSLHRDVLGVQWYGCAALARGFPTFAGFERSVVDSVVEAMRRFDDRRVQQYGCLALASRDLSFVDEDRTMPMMEAAAAAMRRHLGVALLCQWGCEAIFCIAEDGIVRDVSGTGACEAVVAAMQGHPGRRGVQVKGVAALYELSRHECFPKHRAAILAAGGLDVVAAARRRYGDEHLPRAQDVLKTLDKFSIFHMRG
jgi:hypothetical protein